MTLEVRVDFRRTVAQLLEHDIGCRLLALASPALLSALANEIAELDLYNFGSVIAAAAQFVPSDLEVGELVRQHLEHLLWVEHRRALWRAAHIASPQDAGCEVMVEGQEYLEATRGAPTVLITPMVLPYEDALWVAQTVCAEREIAVYGEGVTEDALFEQIDTVFGLDRVHLVGSSFGAVRQILRILQGGGIFLTYPDFVYAGHQTHPVSMLGIQWPMSSAFISICGRPGNMLLPCSISRQENELKARFFQPVELTLSEGSKLDRRWTTHIVGQLVAQQLQAMILCNPTQWLLFSTIIAECAQRADV